MTTSIWDLPFMKHVQPEPNSGCWIWTASCGPNGYAKRGQNKKTTFVHRELFQLTNGPIPKKMDLDHLCRIRCCVNPDHLEIVTRRENLRRGAGPGGHLATHRRRNKASRLLANIRMQRRHNLSRKFHTNARQTSLKF